MTRRAAATLTLTLSLLPATGCALIRPDRRDSAPPPRLAERGVEPTPSPAPAAPAAVEELEAPPKPRGEIPAEVVAAVREEIHRWREQRVTQRAEATRAASLAAAGEAHAPASFLRLGGRPARPHAYFVRALSVTIGGDFDTGGEEEVAVLVSSEGVERRAAAAVLDLPSDRVERFVLRSGALLEVVPSDPVTLEVHVIEEDPHAIETITRTPSPVALPLSAFGSQELRVSVPLEPIRAARWVLVLRRDVVLEGGRVELGLLRVPRRDALDRVQQQAVAQVFADLLPLAPPGAPRNAAEHLTLLRACAERAREAVGRSLHTGLRDTLGALSARALRLADQIERAARSDAANLQASLAQLEGALVTISERERGPANTQALFRRAERLANRRPPAPLDSGEVEEVAQETLAVTIRFEDALAELREPPPSLFAAVDQLAHYLDAVRAAATRELEAARAREELADAWDDLEEAIEEASGG